MKSLDVLLKYAIENNSKFCNHIAYLITKHSLFSDNANQAADFLKEETVSLDLWEMQSLVDPNKFDFKNEVVGVIGVEKDANK